MNAYWKDIFRTIIKEKKRLIALMVIAALGVTMMCGLKASCDDLRQSADAFFDAQHLHDLSIVSTLGLTSEDVKAIEGIDGVKQAEGEYSETLKMQSDTGIQISTLVKTFSPDGMDIPYLKEGRLPEKANEIAVTEITLDLFNKKIGDQIRFKETLGEDETPDFKITTFTITGTVIDVTSVINPDGTTAFRDETCTSATGFVLKTALATKIFSAVNVILDGTEEMDTFSDEYLEKVHQTEDKIKNEILASREDVRTIEVITDAKNELAKAEKEAEEGFAQAEDEMSEARVQLDEGWAAYESGISLLETETQKALTLIASGRQTIADNRKVLEEGATELEEAQKQLDEGRAELEESETLITNIEAIFNRLKETGLIPQSLVEEIETLLNQAKAELEAGKTEIETNQAIINEKRSEIEAGKLALVEAEQSIDEAEKTLFEEKALAMAELESGRKELEEGEQSYAEGYETYLSEKAEVESKLAEAKAEIDAIEPCRWYIRERSTITSFASLDSDAECIEAIGSVFPFMFLLVAVLISLTTITRMIEENRGNIGTYKGLGYRNGEILKKFMIYAGIAAFFGGILGNLLGYIALPAFLMVIFRSMYALPDMTLFYDPYYGIAGILLFVCAICGATWFSCRSTLKQKTAELMRPKAPRIGKVILLERVPFIWTRLSFLSKVTARNLFRYKKRLFMTIVGIMGCTALLLCGFSIKNTVFDVKARQYEDIIQYDFLIADNGGEEHQNVTADLKKDHRIQSMMPLKISTVDIINEEGKSLSVYLYMIPDYQDFSPYLNLQTTGGEKLTLGDTGMAVTENAGTVLHFNAGDSIRIQDMALNVGEGKVNALVTYDLGNAVLVSESAYRQLFPDGDASANAYLINLKSDSDQAAFTDDIQKNENITNYENTRESMVRFSDAFTLINMVVYVVIVLAGALAFVVLFTLSTTNISERERELATIKVLGFVDREVYHYVNKETLILTGLGILFGLPLGVVLSHFIGIVLKLPGIMYRPTIHLWSYFMAAGISLLFALIVNCFTNPVIKKINPVTALKSVE